MGFSNCIVHSNARMAYRNLLQKRKDAALIWRILHLKNFIFIDLLIGELEQWQDR